MKNPNFTLYIVGKFERHFKAQSYCFSKQQKNEIPKISTIKNSFNRSMMKFVNNENKRQEKFLGFYNVFFLSIGLYLYHNFYAFFLLLGCLLFLLAITFLLEKYASLTKKIPKPVYISLFSIWFLIHFYLQNYVLIFIVIIICFFLYIKPEIQNKAEKKDTWIKQFKHDLGVIEYHYQKEFFYFAFLRKFNNILILFLFLLYFLCMNNFINLDSNREVFLTIGQSLAIIYFSNLYLIIAIRWIIIDYCNPKTLALIHYWRLLPV